ncbi:tyrosine-type recombinase/integrase [Bacillus cereus group sp. BceL297]|uniref:tyrosine-type recombinase/integrase n=1 Tax=unclassified Bacillus cereus group TaxID=2750818 RepID=UPI003F283D13
MNHQYFNEEDLKKLEEIRKNKPKKRAKDDVRKQTKKQRQLDQYHNKKEQTPIMRMEANMIKNMDANSHIKSSSRDNEERKTKEDIRIKGGIELDGIIGENTRNTYIKRAKTFIRWCVKNHQTQELKDIKPHMVGEFLKEKIDNGLSPDTIKSYKNGIQKMAQSNAKAGIKRHKELVNEHHQEMMPKMSKDIRTRGRKKDGTTTTLREARIMAKKAHEMSPLHGVMIDIMIEVSPRISELEKIKWEHFDFSQGNLDMTEKNMNKNNRPRWYNEISEKTMGKLEEIYNSGHFQNPNETVFRANIGNERKVREVIKEAARQGKVAYCGAHAFRSASYEYHRKRIEKEKVTKEQLVDSILYHVSADPKLNPEEPKYNRVMVQKTDKNGKPMFYKNGNPIMTNKKDDKGKIIYAPRIGSDGKQVVEPRYTKEELLNSRIHKLKNLYISQLLGHNRTKFSSPYKNG